MKNRRPSLNRPRRRAARRGTVLVLVAFLMIVLAGLAAFSINVVFMETTRTELRAACDAAAKAAIVQLGSTQSESSARAFAQNIASRNSVAGQPLSLTNSQIVFGNAARDASGKFIFTPNAYPLNSARVNADVQVNMLVRGLLSTNGFRPTMTSTAARIDHDICLVLDRSASMAFDLSNKEFQYPSDRSSGTTFQNYFLPPSPTGSRWKMLSDAVGVFVTTLQTRQLNAQVAVVTYSENFTFGEYSSTRASKDVSLTKDYTKVTTAMTNWGKEELLGDTNIEAGLTLGRQTLTGTGSRKTAQRTLILLTDGVPTAGNTDLGAQALAARTGARIITHTIAFGGQASIAANKARLQAAADKGNGKFYLAPSSSELTSCFRAIAEGLPAVLID
jgi:Ca-activated chloride channel family protein